MLSMTIAGGIATVTLSHPPVNAIGGEWIENFNTMLEKITARPDCNVLHIRSDQKVFCAGADLKQIRAGFEAADGADRMYSYVAGIQRLYERIENLPQVSIAEIGGAAMGGGLELALACDLRIAANEAKLGLPEVRLGLIPGAGGTQRLTRLCGRAVAMRLILGAEVIDGKEACALGVVHWAVPRAELTNRTAELSRGITEFPAEALASAKACIVAAGNPGRGGYIDELEATRRLMQNEETRARIKTFLAGSAA